MLISLKMYSLMKFRALIPELQYSEFFCDAQDKLIDIGRKLIKSYSRHPVKCKFIINRKIKFKKIHSTQILFYGSTNESDKSISGIRDT